MRPFLIIIFVLSLSSGCSDGNKAEWKKLQGDWKLVSETQSGVKKNDFKNVSLKIEKGKFILTDERVGENVVDTMDVKIDFSKSLKQIDLVSGEQNIHGILKLVGKELTICVAKGTDRKRPTKFESTKENQTRLLVFERVKKK